MSYRHSCRSELGKWFALRPVKMANGQWAWLRVIYRQHVVRCFLGEYFTYEDTYHDIESALMLKLKGWKDEGNISSYLQKT